MRHLLGCLLCACLIFATPATASTDSTFLAARNAYSHNRITQFEKRAGEVPARYPLHLYLDYWRLKIESAPPEELARFADEHKDSPLSVKAYHDLARYYGKNEDWDHFSQVAGKLPRKDIELTCYALRARLAHQDQTAVGEGLSIWLTAQDLPSSCDPLFTTLATDGFLSDELRLARLRLTLETGNLGIARQLIQDLDKGSQVAIARLVQASKAPDAVLERTVDSKIEREVAYYALGQMARNDPEQAAALWKTKQADFSLPDWRYGWGVIAVTAARQLNPDAVTWFLDAGDQLSEVQNIWKARTMLRAGRWPDVYRSILDMPVDIQDELAWRYWKARALKAMHKEASANPIFARLSNETHYYGLLAGEELPSSLESQPADYHPSLHEIRQVKAMPGIKRALLLHKLDLNFNATEEWNWALRDADDHRLLAAAEIARQSRWYDRAIRTAEKTKTIHNMDLRYLTPYRDLAETYARENDLDPALVYGLIRQESRFVDHARSSAGARGLMQIMPATARWIARHMGLSRRTHSKYAEPNVNIKLGTYYLRQLLTRFDGSAVLATAGYNAGPGRSRKWQADRPLEGAIYVESIPIPETREYVKKVLANAMYYSQRLGVPGGTLKERLGVIPAHPSTLTPDQDDDTDTPD